MWWEGGRGTKEGRSPGCWHNVPGLIRKCPKEGPILMITYSICKYSAAPVHFHNQWLWTFYLFGENNGIGFIEYLFKYCRVYFFEGGRKRVNVLYCGLWNSVYISFYFIFAYRVSIEQPIGLPKSNLKMVKNCSFLPVSYHSNQWPKKLYFIYLYWYWHFAECIFYISPWNLNEEQQNVQWFAKLEKNASHSEAMVITIFTCFSFFSANHPKSP